MPGHQPPEEPLNDKKSFKSRESLINRNNVHWRRFLCFLNLVTLLISGGICGDEECLIGLFIILHFEWVCESVVQCRSAMSSAMVNKKNSQQNDVKFASLPSSFAHGYTGDAESQPTTT